jgi:hypothetical protein
MANIPLPSAQTLKRYGLSSDEWLSLYKKQKGLCLICEEPRRLVIDHFHVKGWKKMLPEKRKLYVRGLLCTWCNYRVVRKGVTILKLENGAKYLREFDKRLCQLT